MAGVRRRWGEDDRKDYAGNPGLYLMGRSSDPMSRENRVELLNRLEESRNSNVVVYFTGDRLPFSSGIAEDAVRLLYKHLLALDG